MNWQPSSTPSADSSFCDVRDTGELPGAPERTARIGIAREAVAEHVRFSLATATETLERGFDRLETMIERW